MEGKNYQNMLPIQSRHPIFDYIMHQVRIRESTMSADNWEDAVSDF